MDEENLPERSLSPVLNKSKLYRKSICERKRRSKTRVQLSKRFREDTSKETECNDKPEFEFKKPFPSAKKFKPNSSGFCTGSGKNIVVSPEALKKHSEMFKDILQVDLNRDNSMVFKKDFNTWSPTNRKFCKQVNNHNIGLSQTETLYGGSMLNCSVVQENVKIETQELKNLKCHGFSVEDCQFPEKLGREFKVFFYEYCERNVSPEIKLNDSTNELLLLDNSLCKIFACEDLSLIASVSNQTKDSGKHVVARDETKSLFNDEKSQVIVESKELNSLCCNVNNEEFLTVDGDHIKACEGYQNTKVSSTAQEIGFSTASGKSSKMSGEAQRKSETILVDKLKELPVEGFSTASVKNIEISDRAQNKIKNLFNDELFCNLQPSASNLTCTNLKGIGFLDTTSKNVGFSTASGKNIEISEKALVKTKNFFGDDFSFENTDKPSRIDKLPMTTEVESINQQKSGFSTASGKKIAVSETSWTKTKDLFANELNLKDSNEQSENDQCLDINFEFNQQRVGFSTASGKDIKISEKALVKTKNFFGDDQNLENPNKTSRIDKLLLNSKVESINQQRCGFSTVSGKKIAVSETTSTQAKDLFSNKLNNLKHGNKNFENSQCSDVSFEFKQQRVGFSTASGKDSNILEKALAKTRNFFCDDLSLENTSKTSKIDKVPFNTKDEIINQQRSGFSTASGKNIEISVKAMVKTKNLFDDELSLENTSKIEKLLQKTDIEFDQEGSGFSSAIGKTIGAFESTLNKKDLFADELNLKDGNEKPRNGHCLNVDFDPDQQRIGFSTASGKNIEISEKAMVKTKKVFGDDLSLEITNKTLQMEKLSPKTNVEYINQKGRGKNIEVFESTRIKTKDLDVDGKEKSKFGHCSNVNFAFNQEGVDSSTASGKNIEISKNTMAKTKNFFGDDMNLENINKASNINKSRANANVKFINQQGSGFSTASGKNINVSEKAWSETKGLFGDEFNSKDTDESSTIDNENRIGISEKVCAENGLDLKEKKSLRSGEVLVERKTIFAGNGFAAKDIQPKIQNCLGFSTGAGKIVKVSEEALEKSKNVLDHELSKENISLDLSNDESFASEQLRKPHSTKKRLGISACKQIQIMNDSLDKAKSFFKELDDNLGVLPMTPVRSTIYSSTPLKHGLSVTKQVLKPNFLTDLNITPVKRPRRDSATECPLIVMQKRTEGDTNTWIKNMQQEYEALQKRLNLILERQKLLQEQQRLLSSQNSTHIRPVLGVLSEKKQLGQRISFKQLLGTRKPGDIVEETRFGMKFYWNITPQSAADVHFNCSWNNESPVIYTKDGAVLIPTTENLVGLSEIKAGFKAMPGIDPKLIPRGWIDNHFKWIVWKLAAYERSFTDIFEGSFTIENIVQQLKYRYDREIDKAERSAIRRILEKDDVPQKRMVLCVSNIIKMGNVLEIELTDGWYSIPTIIDELLRHQIITSKIVVGTKLIVQCAEILNCDGCHPLEVPDYVRLKINFNCTRRAAWDAKLGYQKIVTPFPLSLDSLHSGGGRVGCVKVCIARVYPLRYMEKLTQGKPEWRNAKAEEKRAKEWDTHKNKELEMIHKKVQEQYEAELKSKQDSKMSYNLSQINSPEILYRLYESSNDPDSFKEKLTSSQLEGIIDYHQNMYNTRSSEIAARVSKEIRKVKNTQRDVYPVLKLLIIDRLRDVKKVHVLNIWKPTEDHMQMLKEGMNFLIYNIVLKSNGDFASTNKTYFKSQSTTPGVKMCQRRVISISDLQQPLPKSLIMEFDTVGTVVQINKSESSQNVWMTDGNGNLLLVKVFEDASKCCLFDNINRGQNVAFMNLILCEPRAGFGQGIANQLSLVTCFPQQKFLQEALAKYDEQLPKQKSFLDDCDMKIKKLYCTETKGMGSSISISTLSVLVDSESAVDPSLDDDTMVNSRLSPTEVAMSLIDTDQYFENV